MLIDLHAHTSGISKCCCIPAPEVLRQAKEAGLDGIVLTNHYAKAYVENGDALAFVRRYLEEYHITKALGEALGLKVFFGIEVSMELYPSIHLLIYGVEESFLEQYPTMYDLTQEALYRTVKAHDGVLIQAHPFRRGTTALDTAFLDGVEINCHPLYRTSDRDAVLEVADRAGLLVTCGGDYHADTYRPLCGTYLPDSIPDSVAIGTYLRAAGSTHMQIHEPDTQAPYDFCHSRKNSR